MVVFYTLTKLASFKEYADSALANNAKVEVVTNGQVRVTWLDVTLFVDSARWKAAELAMAESMAGDGYDQPDEDPDA